MLRELEGGILPDLDSKTRFVLLKSMIRNGFPWICSYGRYIVDVATEGNGDLVQLDCMMVLQEMVELGCDPSVSIGDNNGFHDDDVRMLRDLRRPLLMSCQDFLMHAQDLVGREFSHFRRAFLS